MSWFHGKITRELAQELLKPCEPGLYLVRESTNYPGDYTLSVWFVSCPIAIHPLIPCSSEEVGIVDHYRIQGKDGKITVDEESFFNSLEELIKVKSHDLSISYHNSFPLECFKLC